MEGILIAIMDKLLPEVIKKFIPLVKVQPKNLKFTKSEWKSSFSFFVYNRYKQVLFDIYILIDIENAKTDDFELSKSSLQKDLKILVGDIEFNYEILRLNCINENKTEFILLKIAQIDPESFVPFQISANTNCEVKLKIIKYSKKQIHILQKVQSGAVSFEIPLKKGKKVQLKSLGVLLKKLA